MKPTPELMASVLGALMQNPNTRLWVEDLASKPGKGGEMEIWTKLAHEYAVSLIRAANGT